ncbi:MAG: YXWGXW repeat-containing protein [Parafilimonas sp.]
MKKNIVKYLLAVTLLFGFSELTYAQKIYVKVQPTAPVVVRPAAPAPNRVWIDGEWVAGNRNYEWKEGYWEAPRSGYIWVPGHWVGRRRGSYWVPGRWRRV